MSVFEILTPELLDEIPDMDPEAAFQMLARRALTHVAQATPRNDDSSEESWEAYRDAQHTAMNSLIAAAKRLDIEPFSKLDVPRRRDFGGDDFTEFKVELDHYLTQTLLDAAIRARRDSVPVPPKVKDRLRSHISAMRTQIDGADLPETKRAALLKKLAEFEKALERDRLPIFAVARIVFEILSLTANVVTLTDSATFAKLTTTIMQEVAKAKAEDDATRQFPPAEPPRLALPPRAPQRHHKPAMAGDKASASSRFSNDLEDDIPF